MSERLIPATASAGRVAANRDVFERLARVVERRTAEGRFDSALAWCRLAAVFATCHPTGSLRSVRLERTLDAISQAALPPCGIAPAGDRRRVLHVLSEAHVVGGHVRMVVRWAAVDDASVHSFAVTRPGCDAPELHQAASARGGAVFVASGSSLVERARSLRRLAVDADVVVCHTHCDDPVPAVAFGGGYDGPPVVLVNQADHQFFLGTGNVAVVANLRDALLGTDVTVWARGYPEAACCFLPVLVPDASGSVDRAAAKSSLGLDPDRPVVVTVAREEKFRATAVHPGFVEVVEPVLSSRPEAQFVAVGPSRRDPVWAAFADRAGSRVRVVGSCAPEPYLDAADLYLDSFPFASTTSLLEAASRDVPLVGIRLYRGLGGLLGGAGILESAVITADSVHSYRARLAEAVDDESLRERWGRRAGALVRGEHTPDAWRDSLEELYARARVAEPCTERSEPVAHGTEELRDYAAALLGVASGDSLSTLLGPVAAEFDVADRIAIGARRFPTRIAARLGLDPIAGPRTEAALLVPGVVALRSRGAWPAVHRPAPA